MKWLNDLVSGSVGQIVDSVGNAADKLITSDEEREKLKNELVKIKLDSQAIIEQEITNREHEITERWKADAQSDSWLSKNIRPMFLAWLLIAVTTMAFLDGSSDFAVDAAYVTLFGSLLNIAVVAYFGSRGVEKVAKHKYNTKD